MVAPTRRCNRLITSEVTLREESAEKGYSQALIWRERAEEGGNFFIKLQCCSQMEMRPLIGALLLLPVALAFCPQPFGGLLQERACKLRDAFATTRVPQIPPGEGLRVARTGTPRAGRASFRAARMSGREDVSLYMDSGGLPSDLLAELDTAVRLNDLLLVQDLLKVC